ncbi:hypothetical protein EUGRSUZ_F00580 [Eucalyptus grandis]|uniref:Uncharacterized protein n=2 Tax=Eucalyptus grandis TaxID=71139 RepID=A0ACC3KBX7_EUCGR|nr:hypothetical protein EUGRSUZ_F00580 [Eucalyptus grandis]
MNGGDKAQSPLETKAGERQRLPSETKRAQAGHSKLALPLQDPDSYSLCLLLRPLGVHLCYYIEFPATRYSIGSSKTMTGELSEEIL